MLDSMDVLGELIATLEDKQRCQFATVIGVCLFVCLVVWFETVFWSLAYYGKAKYATHIVSRLHIISHISHMI